MISRRRFAVTTAILMASISFPGITPIACAEDVPPALQKSKAQFYNFLRTFVSGQGALRGDQNIVLNSTIYPFDIAQDTPYYNHEIFRSYADRTFSGGVEGIHPNPQTFLAARFSNQYRSLMDIVTSAVDQNHPRVVRDVRRLQGDLDKATTEYNEKVGRLDESWDVIAAQRNLKIGTVEYNTQFAAWAAAVRYADQQESYTRKISSIVSEINATRRRVYKDWEIAVIENNMYLSRDLNVVRPWFADTERSYREQGSPLSELLLANPRNYVPAMFDSSPLIVPVGDLRKFLTDQGLREFDTMHQDSHLDQRSSSWTASGSGRYLFWSAGASGSGSSSMSNSMSNLSSLKISVQNLSEYLVDRGPWFNPAVFLDPNVEKIIKDRREKDYLQYVAVSLIIARGTTLELKFSQAVNSSEWSTSSFGANGGVSFIGFSFGARGGSNSSSYTVNTSADATTVTIKDGDQVARVLGVRVEPFLKPVARINSLNSLPHSSPDPSSVTAASNSKNIEDLRSGKISYKDYISKKSSMISPGQ